MRVGRVKIPTGEKLVVRIEEDRAIEVPGATDVVAVAMARDSSARGREFAMTDVQFLSPVECPPALRDFSVFETHTRNCVEGIGGKMNPLWYDFPVFYFANPRSIIGNGQDVQPPKIAKSIDFELEVACIIGRPTRDLAPDAPDWTSYIAGFSLLNDWSARDIAAQEMKLFMGPVKSKDFATSLGPWLTTPDELDIQGSKVDLPLTARVNGALVSQGNLADMFFSWPAILARASADTVLTPGDVIGSGTCGSGCLLELRLTRGKDKFPWLKSGDTIELEAPALGVLRNTIA